MEGVQDVKNRLEQELVLTDYLFSRFPTAPLAVRASFAILWLTSSDGTEWRNSFRYGANMTLLQRIVNI